MHNVHVFLQTGIFDETEEILKSKKTKSFHLSVLRALIVWLSLLAF